RLWLGNGVPRQGDTGHREHSSQGPGGAKQGRNEREKRHARLLFVLGVAGEEPCRGLGPSTRVALTEVSSYAGGPSGPRRGTFFRGCLPPSHPEEEIIVETVRPRTYTRLLMLLTGSREVSVG